MTLTAACAFAAAAMLVTLRHELPITQIFSSLVITAYPRVLLYVVLAMALLFAAGVCGMLSFLHSGAGNALPLLITVVTSLVLQLFVYLPESYGIRGANQAAYERMTEGVSGLPLEGKVAAPQVLTDEVLCSEHCFHKSKNTRRPPS